MFIVHCHNDPSLAVANTLAAVRAGARQMESTVLVISKYAGDEAVEEVIMAMHTWRIFNTSRRISRPSRFIHTAGGSSKL